MDVDAVKNANDGNIEAIGVGFQEEFEADLNAGTPLWMTPQNVMQGDGATSYYMPEGSAYQAFTPMPGNSMHIGAESPLPGSPTQIDYYPMRAG